MLRQYHMNCDDEIELKTKMLDFQSLISGPIKLYQVRFLGFSFKFSVY